MKSVLISIQPKWCELIASGNKKIEARKTKPKLETPFKCYIYATKSKNPFPLQLWIPHDLTAGKAFRYTCGGKVIGEFTCDRIIEFENSFFDEKFRDVADFACIGFEELAIYLNGRDFGFGWHISDLVIYEMPKELSDFGLSRPPQSWCYVEELEETK